MLSHINPTMKAATIVVSVLMLAFVFDPITPLIFLSFTVLVTWFLGGISIKRWILFFSPFLILGLSVFWMTALYPREPGGTVIFELARMKLTEQSLISGLGLGFRVLSFAALSMMFVMTTNPTKFMLSLMQQCKLPPKLVYGILAGYRFLPTFKDEFTILKQAHRIRGVVRERGIKGYLKQFKRYAIPLLANAIRKAERVAIAMESKGFTGSRDRTHYHEMKISTRDWVFMFAFIIAFVCSAFVSFKLGYFR